MNLAIVKKFVKQCQLRIKAYLALTTQEVFDYINRPDKVTMEEIEKT